MPEKYNVIPLINHYLTLHKNLARRIFIKISCEKTVFPGQTSGESAPSPA
jgi:hypothetical protein